MKQVHSDNKGYYTLKPRGTVAVVIIDQVHTRGAPCTRRAVALVRFQFTEWPLESRRASAGKVIPLVHTGAVLRAAMVNTVINVHLTEGPCVSSGT